MSFMSHVRVTALVLAANAAQAQGPSVTLTPADGSTIEAGSYQQLRVDYATVHGIDVAGIRLFVGADDWTYRFLRGATQATVSIAPSDRVAAGQLVFYAFVPDLDGNSTIAQAAYTVVPKLNDLASVARVGDSIALSAYGLDPNPGNNVLQFTASSGVVTVPLDSVEGQASRGYATVPDGAISGSVALIVNGQPAPTPRTLEVLIGVPDVAITQPSAATITALPGTQFQVDYGIASDPIDLATFVFKYNSQDWTSRFSRQTLSASFTAPVADLVGGVVSLRAEAAHGPALPVAKVSRLLVVVPKFHQVTPSAEPGVAITVVADGLDPDPAKNVLSFAASEGSRVESPFATVGSGQGTVVVPVGARDGLVRLIVNTIQAADEHPFKVSLPVPECGALPTIFRQLSDGTWVAHYRRTERGVDPRCPELLPAPAGYVDEVLAWFRENDTKTLFHQASSSWSSGDGVFGVFVDKLQYDVAFVIGNRGLGPKNYRLSLHKMERPGTPEPVEWPFASLQPSFLAGWTSSAWGDIAPDGTFYFLAGACANASYCIARLNPKTGQILELPVDVLSRTGSPVEGSNLVSTRPWVGAIRASCDGSLYLARNVDAWAVLNAPWYASFHQVEKVDPVAGTVTGETEWKKGWAIDLLLECDSSKALLSVDVPPWDGDVNPEVSLVERLNTTEMKIDDPGYIDTDGDLPWVDGSVVVAEDLVLGRSGRIYWATYADEFSWRLLPEDLWVTDAPPCGASDPNCTGALPYCTAPLLWPGEEPGEGTSDPEGDGDAVDKGASCPRGQGEPVDVITGAVFFSQTDSVLSGIRTKLALTRSYNSRRAAALKTGSFGRGWEWSVDKRLYLKGTRLLLSRGNSSPVIFDDADVDGTWTAFAPRSERSEIVQTNSGYDRTFKSGGTEHYDTNGLLMSSSDRFGSTTTIGRNSNGDVTSITVPGGRTLSLGYTGAHITSVSGPSGPIATYGYTEDSLTSVSYPDGRGYVFAYDPAGRILSVSDQSGKVLEHHTYDGRGRGLTSQVSGGRELLTFDYKPSGDRTVVTDATGGITEYISQIVANVRQLVRVNGPCACTGATEFTEWTWNEATGHVVGVQTALAATATTYTRDAEGNITKITDPLGRETVMTYDSDNRLLTTTAPDLGVWELTHGPAGVLTAKDPLNRVTEVGYDGLGQVVSVKDPRLKTTTIERNSAGDVTKTTDPLNHSTTLTYDASGRLLTATDAANRTTILTRDSLGRVSKVEKPDGKTIELTYDASGRRTAVKDEEGRVTRMTYDAFDRVLAVTDPAGQVTRYDYDLMGRVVALTDAKGQTTRFEYDVAGRLKSTRQPDGKETVLQYDEKGRLKERADQAGRVMTYSYDSISRLTGVQMTGTAPFTYSYDVMDRIQTMSNDTDTLTWAYDVAGEVGSETSARNQSVVSYTYDANGSRSGLSLDGTPFASYGYDNASRLTSITRGSNVFGFGYDAVNRRTSLSHPNGINTTYSYDTLSRLTGIQAVKDLATISTFTYGYDDVGNRTSKNVGDHLENYGYDDLDRLTSVSRTGVGENTWRFGYDAVGNRTSTQVGSGEVVSPTFNNRNQLQQQAVGGALVVEGTLNEEATVSVNGAPARMVTPTRFEATIQSNPGTNAFTVAATDLSGNVRTDDYEVAVSGTASSYGYDAAGNLISKTLPGEAWTYGWNALNQLTSASRNGALQASFQYDPLGRRVVKSTPAKVTTYTYDGADILRENVTAGGITTTSYYVHGPSIDEPLAKETGGVMTYYHADGLGSIVKETSALGAVTNTLRYDAWGNIEAGARDGFAFTGREWDPETGLYYYRARYYDPKLGRFVSEDPIGLRGGANAYGYVGGNPANRTDPRGLDTPDSPRCRRLAEKIENVKHSIQKRLGQLDEDPLGLPEVCEGDEAKPSLSRRGHRRLINEDKKLLSMLELEYMMTCNDGPGPLIPLVPPLPEPASEQNRDPKFGPSPALALAALVLLAVITAPVWIWF